MLRYHLCVFMWTEAPATACHFSWIPHAASSRDTLGKYSCFVTTFVICCSWCPFGFAVFLGIPGFSRVPSLLLCSLVLYLSPSVALLFSLLWLRNFLLPWAGALFSSSSCLSQRAFSLETSFSTTFPCSLLGGSITSDPTSSWRK